MRDGTQLPLGEYVLGVGTGTTFWNVLQCGPAETTVAVATPPAPTQQLPATGGADIAVGLALASIITLAGIAVRRIIRIAR
jgi:hypothetical protein